MGLLPLSLALGLRMYGFTCHLAYSGVLYISCSPGMAFSISHVGYYHVPEKKHTCWIWVPFSLMLRRWSASTSPKSHPQLRHQALKGEAAPLTKHILSLGDSRHGDIMESAGNTASLAKHLEKLGHHLVSTWQWTGTIQHPSVIPGLL